MKTTYYPIVFLQGEEAMPVLEMLDKDGKRAAMNYLQEWDCGERYDGTDRPCYGKEDLTVTFAVGSDGYILSWNNNIGYIGLEAFVNEYIYA